MTNLLYIKANFEDLSDLVVASQTWEPFFGDTSSTFCLKSLAVINYAYVISTKFLYKEIQREN